MDIPHNTSWERLQQPGELSGMAARAYDQRPFFGAAIGRAVLKPGNARAMCSRLRRTRSSAVEHYVDIVGVTGSIPVVSTI